MPLMNSYSVKPVHLHAISTRNDYNPKAGRSLLQHPKVGKVAAKVEANGAVHKAGARAVVKPLVARAISPRKRAEPLATAFSLSRESVLGQKKTASINMKKIPKQTSPQNHAEIVEQT